MRQANSVQAFPWQELIAVQGEHAKSGSAHRRLLNELCAFDGLEQRLEETLDNLFSADLQGVRVVEEGFGRGLPDSLGADLHLRTSQSHLWFSLEPALLSFLVRRLLRTPAVIDRPENLSGALQGAVHAIANEVARRVCTGEPPSIDGSEASTTRPKDLWHIHFWCRISGASFRGNLAVHPTGPLPAAQVAVSTLPIKLRMVIAQTTINRDELSTLRIGDSFLLQASEVGFAAAWGGGSEDGEAAEGQIIAAAPTVERGLLLRTSGNRLIFAGPCEIPFEPPTDESEANPSMNDPNEAPPSSAFADTRPSAPPDGTDESHAVLSAPVTVRFELGAVSMSAKDWLKLDVGDVIDSAKPVGTEVTLRVGGQVIGYGKLVTVDGNLGVQLSRVSSGA